MKQGIQLGIQLPISLLCKLGMTFSLPQLLILEILYSKHGLEPLIDNTSTKPILLYWAKQPSNGY